MERFRSWDGVAIAYAEHGASAPGPWVILQHGYVADGRLNWELPGVVAALVGAGRRVLTVDARGHGRSDKPHDPARYGESNMAEDLRALFDRLGEPEVDLVGYSMGAVVALICASRDERVRRLAVGGVGAGVVECGGLDTRAVPAREVAAAMRAVDPQTIRHAGAAGMRRLADAVGADREALAAHADVLHQGPIALDAIRAPTLVFAGDRDELAARPQVLVAAIAGARLQVLAGDHMGAVADPRLSESLIAFLAG